LYSCNCQTWELRGRYPNRGYPKIFQDTTVGAEAQKLFDDAQVMLKDIVANKRLSLTGVLGIYPANRYIYSIVSNSPSQSSVYTFFEVYAVYL
jgi:cobalamin-dependent methionine synthase I